ncbi:MAG: hypothetical protein CSA58_01070 [Micrococcales bacterium]|nr:MAG: hypothetical protein CSA58_01070 [Micrococcales bacterium]
MMWSWCLMGAEHGPFPVGWTRGLPGLMEGWVVVATRRRFTDEYKRQAVEFVLDSDRPVAEVARNIGCHEMTLGKWVKKERESRAAKDPGEPLDASERAELVRLREQTKTDRAKISELEMQVEFAKKVATWFASQKQ